MFLFDTWLADFSAAAAILLTVFYLWVTHPYDFWKSRNVPYIKPTFPFGNFGQQYTGKANFAHVFEDFYRELKKYGYGGVFNIREPVLVVCDPELIKQILTKDFNSFHDRGGRPDEVLDDLSASLLNLRGARWKTLRAKLSPTFSSGKIRVMFPLIQEVTKEFQDCIRADMKVSSSIDLKDLLVRFTTDVIGSCAFGINCNSLKNPKSEFHTMSRTTSKFTATDVIKFVFVFLFPKFKKVLKVDGIFSESKFFFSQLMSDTVNYRRDNNVYRNDFVQLMMKILDEEKNEKIFNQNIMTAQALQFFFAGLDNVANTIGFCLHAMTVDSDLQDRVYREIDSVLRSHGGEMSYEALKEMDLVSRVVDEGLRMHNPAGSLSREITESKYVIPGTSNELNKGTKVLIPIQSLFNDEQYFPNPRQFDPDRFTEGEKAKRHAYAYIPFGEGPRSCIASRFAQLEMRLCLAELVRQFSFNLAPETDLSLQLKFTTTAKRGFWFRILERNTGMNKC